MLLKLSNGTGRAVVRDDPEAIFTLMLTYLRMKSEKQFQHQYFLWLLIVFVEEKKKKRKGKKSWSHDH